MNDIKALTRRVRTHVECLAGEIGERNVFVPQALAKAAAYIEAEWCTLGYGVEQFAYQASGIRCVNLIATRKGSVRCNEIVLLGTHYDSVIGSPGANDNASGVAALLEISRMFQALNRRLQFVLSPSSTKNRHSFGLTNGAAWCTPRPLDVRATTSSSWHHWKPSSTTATSLAASAIHHCSGFSFPTAAISSGWSRTSAPGQPCGTSRRHFARLVRLSFADAVDVSVRSRGGLERPPFLLASALSGADGHRHRILPLPALPRVYRYARQACLS